MTVMSTSQANSNRNLGEQSMHAPPVAALAESSRMRGIKSICHTNPALHATSNTVYICLDAVMLLASLTLLQH